MFFRFIKLSGWFGDTPFWGSGPFGDHGPGRSHDAPGHHHGHGAGHHHHGRGHGWGHGCEENEPLGTQQYNADAGSNLIKVPEGYAAIIAGNEGDDTMKGGEFDDLLFGNRDDDLIYGNDGDDTLYGGLGSDTLDGGRGNDVISGDAGLDFLSGGAGEDRFEFRASAIGDGLVDTIMDFDADADTILFLNEAAADVSFAQNGADVEILVDGVTEVLVTDADAGDVASLTDYGVTV
ncbi:calcium-binding protein [Salipiger abyssi]|uniref:calcium-binding protein n=1 Tax=Salipiger abyssi TaxID=1250539 RepID=UPI0012EC9725|nr:hypothetical protein [Salipiger abyssi]